tara:strand:- start:7864 stop:8712 length:849 start_codon:yes stop_codon:yes gene_type:complete
MGLGGYLCWTAVAREVNKINPGLKCMPVELYNNGSILKTIKSEIFLNNSSLYQEWEHDVYSFPLVLNNPQSNYCKKDTPEKAVHRYDKHIIEQYCETFGIENPELKCVINLTEEENEKVNDLMSDISFEFVTINTDVNKEYTSNKFENFEFWQKVVDSMPHLKFVQIGLKGKKLKNAIDLTGKTTFREAAGIISRSKCFVGSEGGLVHAATAFDVPSLVMITSFIHPDLVSYPGNTNIWMNKDGHGPCGMKHYCQKCHDNMSHISVEYVCQQINKILEVKNG